MNKNVIAFGTDSKYIHYAIQLLKSLKYVGTAADIVCKCVDVSETDIHDHVFKDVNIIFDNPGLSSKKSLMKNLGLALHYTYGSNTHSKQGIDNMRKALYSPRAAYTCHSRFQTITELLAKGYNCVVYIDTDTIFNKNIDILFDDVSYDVRVVPTIDKGVTYMFRNEGLLVINNTPASRKFFSDVSKYIFYDDGYLDWDIDSTALQKLYTNDIRVGFLDDSFKDRTCSSNAYMWSGDGINKYKNTFKWSQ